MTSRLVLSGALALVLVLGGGCLDSPEIEDQWTRVDLESVTYSPVEPLFPSSRCSVFVRTKITYRRILTGYSVTELRAVPGMAPGSWSVATDADRERMAQNIDSLLANSVSMGRVARAVTGWDHLIQTLDQRFGALVPATTDTSGAPVTLFLVSYLGSGEEIELDDGRDSVIVTPFLSADAQVLPTGAVVQVVGAAAP